MHALAFVSLRVAVAKLPIQKRRAIEKSGLFEALIELKRSAGAPYDMKAIDRLVVEELDRRRPSFGEVVGTTATTEDEIRERRTRKAEADAKRKPVERTVLDWTAGGREPVAVPWPCASKAALPTNGASPTTPQTTFRVVDYTKAEAKRPAHTGKKSRG